MNIENKKTALDDDSLLYQKRDESFGKKDTSSMSKKEKAGYFKDYYLRTVLIAAAVLILAGSVIYTTLFRHQESILGIAFIDEAYAADTTGLNDHLRDFYELTDKNEYLDISNYNLSDYTSQIKFSTLTSGQAIDIVFVDEDNFEKYSQMGYFADLSELLPPELYEKIKSRIIESSEVETDQQGNITETYPAAPHGINISGNSLYKDFGGMAENVIIGVVANTEHQENTIRFIEHLISYGAEEAGQAE